MIGVTHCGKIGDFGYCLPICSWLYKTYNQKIIFILPRGIPFVDKIDRLLNIQPFTERIIFCDFHIHNFDMGGRPYKFNPHDYVKDLQIETYYNFGFRYGPDKYIPEFMADEYGLGVDYDFTLNLDLDFKYESDKIMCSELLLQFFPNFEIPDFSKDFLDNLRDLAYAKERHLHASSLAVYSGFAKIPYYFYPIAKDNYFVDVIEYKKFTHNDFQYLFYHKFPLLDVRMFDKNNKIISVFNKVF